MCLLIHCRRTNLQYCALLHSHTYTHRKIGRLILLKQPVNFVIQIQFEQIDFGWLALRNSWSFCYPNLIWTDWPADWRPESAGQFFCPIAIWTNWPADWRAETAFYLKDHHAKFIREEYGNILAYCKYNSKTHMVTLQCEDALDGTHSFALTLF